MSITELLTNKGYEPIGDFSSQVEECEAELELEFAPDFKEYLLKYGQLSIDASELTGVVGEPYLNVENLTKDERKYIPGEYADMYVIESLGVDGIVIWQATDGQVFQTIPGAIPEKIYDSFEEYLLEEVFE
jgi:hypothetical protein